MKKIKILVSFFASIFLFILLVACGPKHTHEFVEKSNESNHWKECECGEVISKENHDFGGKYSYDLEHHWKECKCGVRANESGHQFSETYNSDNNKHWKECECGARKDEDGHNFGEWEIISEATEESKGSKKRVCLTCMYEDVEEIAILEHQYEDGICINCNKDENGNRFTFTLLEDGTYEVDSVALVSNSIVIPSKYKDCFVTSIGYEALRERTSLTSVYIPSTVTKIDNYAFFHDVNLETVTFEEKSQIKSIGNKAFAYCSALKNFVIPEGVISLGEGIFLDCSSITNISIPKGVTIIPDSMCEDCSSLTEIVIPSQIKSIGTLAFDDCVGIQSILFEEGSNLEIIKDRAFDGCKGITSIVIPKTVHTIEMDAFFGCKNLVNLSFEEGSQISYMEHDPFEYCSSLTYNTYNNGKYLGNEKQPYLVLISNTNNNLTEVNIHPDTRVISEGAFRNCYQLTSVIFEEGSKLVSISYEGFSGCSNISNIKLPDSLLSIGSSAFMGCTKLNNIIIPENVEYIGRFSFSDCSSLREIVIPESVTVIDDFAFYQASSLANITIPSTVVEIGEHAFTKCNASAYKTYKSGKYLGNATNPYFVLVGTNSTTIQSITINANTQFICQGALSSCTQLTTVDFDEGAKITTINRGAFYDCNTLSSITIPKSVTKIEDYAFYGCKRIAKVNYSGSSEEWNQIYIGTNNTYLLDAYKGDGFGPEDEAEEEAKKYRNLIYTMKQNVMNQGQLENGIYTYIFSIDFTDSNMYTGLLEYDLSSEELSLTYFHINNAGDKGCYVTFFFGNNYNPNYYFIYEYTSPTVNNEGAGYFYAPTFTSSSAVSFSWHSGDWTEYVSSTYCALMISMGLNSLANSSTYDMALLGFNNYDY